MFLWSPQFSASAEDWSSSDNLPVLASERGWCGIAIGPESLEAQLYVSAGRSQGLLQAGRTLALPCAPGENYRVSRPRVPKGMYSAINRLQLALLESPSELEIAMPRPNGFYKGGVQQVNSGGGTKDFDIPFVGRRQAAIQIDPGADFPWTFACFGIRYNLSTGTSRIYFLSGASGNGQTAAATSVTNGGDRVVDIDIGGMDNAEAYDLIRVRLTNNDGAQNRNMSVDADTIGELGAF